MEVTLSSSGSFKKTESFLKEAAKLDVRSMLEKYGQTGTNALSSATPVDSGATSSSWYHEVSQVSGGWVITWYNSNVKPGFNVAVMLQYGHGTGTGGWVQGRDYINPALRPIFDQIADKAWKAVVSA